MIGLGEAACRGERRLSKSLKGRWARGKSIPARQCHCTNPEVSALSGEGHLTPKTEVSCKGLPREKTREEGRGPDLEGLKVSVRIWAFLE